MNIVALSIVIPVFNEEENINPLYNEIKKFIPDDSEVIFVDDGSSDKTLLEIMQLSQDKKFIKCISLSRNFGHQSALMAGLHNANGHFIITMDGDLQHPADLIPAIIEKLSSGYDIVITKRSNSKHSKISKSLWSKMFYRCINYISDVRIEPDSSDFRAFNKKVLSNVLLFKEREIFLRGIFSWVGFKSVTISYDAIPRKFGKTKYTFKKMTKLALNGITSFSFKPLRIAIFTGSIISLAAFAFAFFALISYFRGNTVPGWASIIIAIMLLGGTQLLAIGFLGEYLTSLFIESKNRPLYIIDKKINFD